TSSYGDWSSDVCSSDLHWATNTLYFKAGSYCQDNTATNNDEGSRVAFYSLTRSHTPSITNQPVNRSAVLGSNTTFTVSATGNGQIGRASRRERAESTVQ